MSSEESYLAILRYLTNEREPYAPGTEGNAKRKIRKAAACYVVREGTLYYQRKLRDKEGFTELEVVLQPERRKGLIEAAHINTGGEHLTRHQTWHVLSQSYWWRGILKHMKDYIKDCSKCQERTDRSRSTNDASEMLEELGLDARSDTNETDDESSNPASNTSHTPKTSRKKPTAKHELVFDKNLKPTKLSWQPAVSTLRSSSLKKELLRVMKLLLIFQESVMNFLYTDYLSSSCGPRFCKSSFLPLLEFAYTSELVFDFCSMAEISMLARHLFMNEVLEICESVHRQMETNQINLCQKVDVVSESSCLDGRVVELQTVGINAPPLLAEVITSQKTSLVNNKNVACEPVATETVTNSTDGVLSQLSEEPTVHLVTSPEVPISSLTGMTAIYLSDMSSELQTAVIIPAVKDISNVHEHQQILSDTQEDSTPAEHSESPQSTGNGNMDASDKVQPVTLATSENKLPADDPQPKDVCLKEFAYSSTNGDPQISVSVAEEPSISVIDLETTCAEDVVIGNTDPEQEFKSEVPKRKRGRPRKSPEDVEKSSKETKETLPSDDKCKYKGKLRDCLVGTGGYIKLHKGQGKPLKKRKTNPKSAVQQAAMKLLQRGKKKRLVAPKKQTAEAQFKCNDCGMMFQRRYALLMHSVKHEKSKEFKCPLCTKEFQYSASLRAHLIRHSKTGKAEVNVVETETDTVKGGTKRQFICGICGRTLPKLYSLRIHMLKHTGVKPHACEICGKAFTHRHGLKMHQALHEAHKQFKCHMCDKSFVTNRSLQEHVSTHTGESKYLCSVCGKAFHRASGLSKHLKKHKPKVETRGYHCTQCEKSFFELRDLQQHMNKHLGVKPFECEFCGKSYSWKKDWYSHVKSHSVTEPYRCSVCGKEFYEKALYRRHVNKATHGKKGRTKLNFEKACEHCGKIFTQFREYRRHVNNHEGVKPFECITCGVAWADARSLKRHVRTHTGERPYVCPVCNEGYIDARTLRKHMTKTHKDYVPGKIMLEKDSLQFHNQGTQVEHAVSILSTELDEPQAEIVTEEIETAVVAEEAMVQALNDTAVSSLSDQSIMQVVNYVLAQQQGQKMTDVSEELETVEVEVGQISEVV
ncbi:zinc finger and BTB domain-containing protein 11 isoform X3 [Xenopus laevis]|uniref:Zinc finger and BTB domain-containing protein 11 isoform X3 n=1 Tax=Xenopus laevis TaxID=8355 RepID=A0A8J1MA53_XENLA|nr:zinc finger and BTB domain-containing protein 11 isoform X3 [Xenopus laevis]